MANRSKRKRTALQGLLILLVLAGLFPVPVTCGAPTATCMPAPDPQGYVSVYYELDFRQREANSNPCGVG